MIIVTLIGLKKCGKTTTAEALISEFRERGYKVGAVKFMPHSSFTIDIEGKDTWRQKNAGAEFVISLSKDEMAYIEERKQRASLSDALRLVPEDTDVLICEGFTGDHPGILRVVLAKTPELLNETFVVRGFYQDHERIDPTASNIIAFSGIMTSSLKNEYPEKGWKRLPDYPEVPVFDCTDPSGRKGLVDLILGNRR